MRTINRITGIMLFMLVFAVMGAYANGQADNACKNGPAAGFEKKEAVTLSGTVTVRNRMAPELFANGKSYYLLVPRFLAAKAGIKDGDTVGVSGYIVVAPDNRGRWQAEGLEPLVLVEKATVNGKEYDIKEFAGKGRGQRGCRRDGGKGGPGFGPEDCPYRNDNVD